MNNLLCLAVLMTGLGLCAQTSTTIVKPDSGQTDYIISAASGVVDLQATDYIRLTPNTHIQGGSNFIARIIDDLGPTGTVINTTNLPNSRFEIMFEESTLENLVSGTEDSKVFVETGPDSAEDKVLLINVDATTKNAALNLRITKNQNNYKIEVYENGNWLMLSQEFYEVNGDKIIFSDKDIKETYPFTLNLINGVEYNRTEPLTLSIDTLLNVSGGSLLIVGPDGFLISLNPNVSENNFTWDGSQAAPGVYQFRLQLQGKLFNGQFLIL